MIIDLATARRRPAATADETGGTHPVEFEEFLAREWDGLSRYARVLSDSRHEAEDLLADALLKAQRHWRRITNMTEPLAYVRRIVTTTAISRRRTWAARHIRLTRTGDVPDSAMPTNIGARIEQQQQVTELLSRLAPQQRAAVALRYLLDRTDPEIAAELRCSQSTVRSYIARALQTLRTAPGSEY